MIAVRLVLLIEALLDLIGSGDCSLLIAFDPLKIHSGSGAVVERVTARARNLAKNVALTDTETEVPSRIGASHIRQETRKTVSTIRASTVHLLDIR